MPSAAQRFNPQQEKSETGDRPFSVIAHSPSAQWNPDDPAARYEIVLPSRQQLLSSRPLQSTQNPLEITRSRQSLFTDAPPALRDVRRLVPPPRPRERFILLQKWEGTVGSVSQDTFTAVMRDLTDASQPDEEMTLPI